MLNMSHDIYFDLAEAKARIFELEYHLTHIDAKNKENEDIIQDLKKQLQKAKEYENMATSVIEALSAKR
jgi:uncharacterized membrane protein